MEQIESMVMNNKSTLYVNFAHLAEVCEMFIVNRVEIVAYSKITIITLLYCPTIRCLGGS